MITSEVEIKKEQELQCYHCGNPCSDKIGDGEHYFCCVGCKTVFEILSVNELEDYYEYEKNPGITMLNKQGNKYEFLDNKEIADSLLQFSSLNLAKVVLYIPGIHCSSCIWLLENLHKLHPGVSDSRVNFMKKEAAISFNPEKISLRELAELMDSIGYGPLINWDSTEKKSKKKSFGSLQVKLGIAGFCFGNIMLLSFPEYFGFEISDGTFKRFFSYLNLLLAIPVLLYSGRDYLISAFRSIRQRWINIDVPIALGMLTLFIRSSYEVLLQTGPGFFDSFTGFVFFLLVGKWFQDKTYEHLSFERDFKSYFPLAVNRKNGEGEEIVTVKELRNGDIIRIRNNEIIPTDCVLLSPTTEIDYSFVTGEQAPITLNEGDSIYAGGRQKGMDIILEVSKPVSQSYLTGLWNSSGENTELKSQKIIDKVARYFTVIVLLIASLTAAYWSFSDTTKVWESVTAVLIVACPCALALSVPFTYGNILRVTGKNKLYMKSADVVEKFAGLNTVIFDKTGTLTWANRGEVAYQGQTLSEIQISRIITMAGASFHPLSKKIKNYLKGNAPSLTPSLFEEIPGKGLRANFDGIECKLGNVSFAGAPEDLSQTDRSVVSYSENGKVIGWFEVHSSFREGIDEVIKNLSESYQLGLLSGDNDSDKPRLSGIFPAISPMVFGLKPDEKRDFIKDLLSRDNKVLMLGDGLNDAAALAEATVGIAVTDDVSAFSPACDAIMDGTNFSSFEKLLRFIKSSRGIVIGSFVLSFIYNIAGLSFAVSGELTPIFAAILMPLSSISVLLYTTITVNLSARLKGL